MPAKIAKRTEHGPTDTYFAGCGLQNRDYQNEQNTAPQTRISPDADPNRDYQNEQNTAPQTRISPDADPNPGWRRFLTQRYQKDKDIS